ncbi:MAG: calcium-binding protein, partial [Oxalobacteraceae bacterium]
MASAEIGMNLNTLTYYSNQYPFLDRYKTSGSWNASNSNWQGVAGPVLDANGYPTAMAAGASQMYVMLELDPASLDMPDVYVLRYKGEANITLQSAQILSSKPGEIIFKYSGGNMTPLTVWGMNPDKPLSQINIVRQDQLALFDAGEIFNPAFLEKVTPFSTVRYMDWQNTNGTDVSKWEDRISPDDASYNANGNKSGAPIEIMVALANKTHTNMWINIPTKADDDYVTKTLQYVRDHLDPGLKVQIEYSNEVWNWQFTQSHYALSMGDQLFGKDSNNDGVIDSNNPAEHVPDGWTQYYGYRSAQIALIAKAVFADDPARARTVISSQTAWTGLETGVLKGVQRVGNVASLFDDYAITNYFDLGTGDEATLLKWARGGEDGLTAGFAAIMQNISNFKTTLAYQANVAKAWGLDLVSYEAGVHTTSWQFPSSSQPEIQAFLEKLGKDPRMATAYQQ